MEAMLEGDRTSKRMAELERRVLLLEQRAQQALALMQSRGKEEELVSRYGEYVDKTVAAKILGVTRVTVYAMLADGRILGACAGRRVDVRSIARYLTMQHPGENRREENQNKRKTEENGHECA